MALPTPKYAIGDTVWYGWFETRVDKIECPDCGGTGKWSCTTPAGETFDVQCPTCAPYMQNHRRTVVTADVIVRRMTIGSVRIDTGEAEHPVSYMCVETGVGSGSIYNERMLFDDEASAKIAAEPLARAAAERMNQQNGLTKRDREINFMPILEAKVADAERASTQATDRLRKWGYALEDAETDLILRPDGPDVDQRDIAAVIEHLRQKLDGLVAVKVQPAQPAAA